MSIDLAGSIRILILVLMSNNTAKAINLATTTYRTSGGTKTCKEWASRYTVTEVSGHHHITEHVPSCGVDVYLGRILGEAE